MSHRQVTNILFFNHNVIFLINYKSVNFLCFTYQKWFCLPHGIHNLAIAFQFRRFVNQGWYFLPFGIYNLTAVRISSKDSLIKDAFLFFLVCIQKKPPEVFFVKKYSPKNTYFVEHLWKTASMYYHFTVALALF